MAQWLHDGSLTEILRAPKEKMKVWRKLITNATKHGTIMIIMLYMLNIEQDIEFVRLIYRASFSQEPRLYIVANSLV